MEPRNLHDVTGCIGANLRMATRAVTQRYDEALRPVGLHISQFTLLATLSMTGQITIGELAERTTTDRTTLTRNLRPLALSGLVTIAPGGDRRERWLALTSQGDAVLQQALPLWEEAQSGLIDALGSESTSDLLTLLGEAAQAARNL